MTLADRPLEEWTSADAEARRAAVRSWRETIARRDAEIRAWAVVADEPEEAAVDGPLRGLPIAVKDIFDVAGMPTEFGSPLYKGRVPERDCALAAHLKRRGAVVLGKTHTTAFAYFDAGPTRNPRNLELTPGGSSSGSAAAVAAGMAPVAIGSQTMGSVLRPASFCGIVGFKPSFGRLPMEGVLPFAPSLDHPGYFTRTVADMAYFWSAAHAEAPSDCPPNDVAALPWPIEGELEAPMREAFEAALEALGRAGFKVHRIPLPESFRALPPAIAAVLAREAAETHRERFLEHGQAIGAKLARLVEEGRRVGETPYREAREAIARAAAEYAAMLERYPLTATPAALGPAPRGLDSTGDPRANAPWTALGVPAISLPMPVADDDPPLGLQLTAGRGRESDLLGAALSCEQAPRASVFRS